MIPAEALHVARVQEAQPETAVQMVVAPTQQPIGNLVVLGTAYPDVPTVGLADSERLTRQPNRYAPGWTLLVWPSRSGETPSLPFCKRLRPSAACRRQLSSLVVSEPYWKDGAVIWKTPT